jgi:hypothetical protein
MNALALAGTTVILVFVSALPALPVLLG